MKELETLTTRELEVFVLAVRGLSNKEIAEKIGMITVPCVKGRLTQVYKKVHCKNKAQLIVKFKEIAAQV